jgi:hypothetical protein
MHFDVRRCWGVANSSGRIGFKNMWHATCSNGVSQNYWVSSLSDSNRPQSRSPHSLESTIGQIPHGNYSLKISDDAISCFLFLVKQNSSKTFRNKEPFKLSPNNTFSMWPIHAVQCLGSFWAYSVGQAPSDSKPNRLHVDIFRICFYSFEVYSFIHSSKMVGNYPGVLNFNRLFLKLNWSSYNYLPVLPQPWCNVTQKVEAHTRRKKRKNMFVYDTGMIVSPLSKCHVVAWGFMPLWEVGSKSLFLVPF